MRSRSPLLFVLALGLVSAAAAWQSATEPDAPDQLLPVLRGGGPAFWKGNLHTHSFWSDGDDFPEMIADWYKRHGYQFLGLSDHNILSEGQKWLDVKTAKGSRELALKKYQTRFGDGWVERRMDKGKEQVRLKPLAEFRSLLEAPGRFLLVPAEEVTHRYAKFPVHINAINMRDAVQPINGDSVAETIQVNLRLIADQRKKTGWRNIAFVNHPNFGWGVRAEDMVLAEELRFFEVFNGHPGVKNYGDDLHVSTEKMWDIVLALRLGKHKLPLVYGMATDDAHGYHAYGVGKVNPGRGWIMVRAAHLTAEALVGALEAGDFYMSTGVTLKDVHRQKDRVALTIAAEKGVQYKTQFVATLKDAALTSEARLDAKGQPAEATRLYSPEIGKVVAESEALDPTYTFTGQELYVRAKITSTKPHANPYQKGDVEVAWTQPFVP